MVLEMSFEEFHGGHLGYQNGTFSNSESPFCSDTCTCFDSLSRQQLFSHAGMGLPAKQQMKCLDQGHNTVTLHGSSNLQGVKWFGAEKY